MSRSDDLIAYTNFDPADPVVDGRMFNCQGITAGNVAQPLPARTAAGIYRILVQQEMTRSEVSVITDGMGPAGATRIVNALFAAPASFQAGTTIVDLFIFTDAGVASDDAINVEFTCRRLPFAPLL